MRRFLVLVLAGLALSAGGCKKERPAGIVMASAGESRAAQPEDLKSLGYAGASRAAPALPSYSRPRSAPDLPEPGPEIPASSSLQRKWSQYGMDGCRMMVRPFSSV